MIFQGIIPFTNSKRKEKHLKKLRLQGNFEEIMRFRVDCWPLGRKIDVFVDFKLIN